MRILLLTLSLLFTQELEVQGDLKVSGSIDAQNNPVKNVGVPQSLTDAINGNVLQDALRDDGNYEYKFILGRVKNFSSNTDGVERWSQYMILSEIQVGTSNWTDGLSQILNQHSSEGWQIKFLDSKLDSYAGSSLHILYQLKRPIEE